MMKKRGEKRIFYLIILSVVITSLLISFASAGWADWVKKTISGKATTASVEMNVTVGVPKIIWVWNQSIAVTPNNAPATTSVIINFTVYTPAGTTYLNDSTARVNFTRTNEDTRRNNSCMKTANWSSVYANYSCNITMWWWDGNGTWDIGAYIEDNSSNGASNTTSNFAVADSLSFSGGPGNITWSTLASGATNQTPTNDPYILNNSGNVPASIQVNSTNLRGETDPTVALWANNFSISWDNGGTPPAECSGTAMVAAAFTTITTANLTKGNFTVNNGNIGQEDLYFCLKKIGAELTTQAYSTRNESYWTVKIV